MTSRHTDMTDIRAWLRENRPDLNVQPKGKVAESAVEIYREANGITGEVVPERDSADAGEDARADAPEVAPERAGESSRSWLGRKVAPKAKTGSPKRRTAIDGIMSFAWGGAAQVLARQPQLLPVARCLAIQAPAAGMVLDEALRGSLIDRALQPVARAGKRGEAMWAVAGPPVLVSAISMHPELYPVLQPMLREAVKSWILIAGPKIKKAQERERKLLEELDGDMTTIDEIIASFFMPPEGYQEGADGAAQDTAGAAA